jgi:hypothetical protein
LLSGIAGFRGVECGGASLVPRSEHRRPLCLLRGRCRSGAGPC